MFIGSLDVLHCRVPAEVFVLAPRSSLFKLICGNSLYGPYASPLFLYKIRPFFPTQPKVSELRGKYW